MYGKWARSAACIVALAGCARHKLTPVATPLPSQPAIGAPAVAARAPSEIKIAPSDKKAAQPVNSAAEVNRLLNEPPRMNLVPGLRSAKAGKDVQRVDKITVLVDTTDGTLRPTSEAMIQNAFMPLADQFLLVCPDRMRVGTTGGCRFAPKEPLEELFRQQLVWQGVPASEAEATTLLVHADLTSPEKNTFDIRPAEPKRPSGEQLWRVAPLNAGDHKLELKVTLSARIGSAGEVQSAPVVLVRSVSVVGETFFNQYWPAMIGCAALLGLFGWIAMTFWRNAQPSAIGSR